MCKKYHFIVLSIFLSTSIFFITATSANETTNPSISTTSIGKEIAVMRHLKDGNEFDMSMHELIKHGRKLFRANWTIEEGGGRPLTKGIGDPLSDSSSPLLFPRNFNRLSAPDSNSCAGCHNKPRVGGGGDIVTNVFITGERFDSITFDHSDTVPLRGAVDEESKFVQLNNFANFRNTLGLFGSGYIEMLSRQMTTDLRKIRDSISAGSSAKLESKGISFGSLARNTDGSWDTNAVTGLLASSLVSDGPENPPSLIIKPFHQAGGKVSLREFTNNAFNQHHGIQSTERFGSGTDPDGDGFTDEITRADITAATLFQAQLAVPGRVIPNNSAIEAAIYQGELAFQNIGCASCHVPKLPLDNKGWIFSEPNPYNPEGNLQIGQAPEYKIDLTDKSLDNPRLTPENDIVWVPAFTDLKLHDITSGLSDPNREPVDQNASGAAFFKGNSRFITRKLWGVANEPPYFHHGKYTTLRQAIDAHRGEAMDAYNNWTALSEGEKDSIIEFLKSLKVLPKDTKYLVVDEHGQKKRWPPEN